MSVGVTERVLNEFAARGREPRLHGRSGTVRLELRHGGKTHFWRVSIARGRASVERGRGKAETVIKADIEVFDQVADGTMNAMAAMLRGEITVEGDAGLALVLERLLPGPPHGAEPEPGSEAGRTAAPGPGNTQQLRGGGQAAGRHGRAGTPGRRR